MKPNYDISACDSSSLALSGRLFFSPSQCGFLLCLNGALTVTVFGTIYNLRQGDLMVFHPFVKAEYSEISPDMHGFIGVVDLTKILPVVNQVINSENLIRMRKNPVVPLSGEQVALLTSHFRKYSEAMRSAQQTSAEELDVLNAAILKNCGDMVLLEVLRLYFTNRPSVSTELSARDIIFQKFMLDVQEYCTSHRDTMFYARRSGLSPKYFSTVIREHSGATPSEWIIQNVIAEAKHLLSDLSLSIKEIAEALKFPSQADFTKYFRRYTAVTPSAYRNGFNLKIRVETKTDSIE